MLLALAFNPIYPPPIKRTSVQRYLRRTQPSRSLRTNARTAPAGGERTIHSGCQFADRQNRANDSNCLRQRCCNAAAVVHIRYVLILAKHSATAGGGACSRSPGTLSFFTLLADAVTTLQTWTGRSSTQ